MPELIIISRSLGAHRVLFDEADSEVLTKYSWSLRRTDYSRTLYVFANPTPANQPYCNKRLHAILMGVVGTEFEVDHINGNGLDNRRQNLRVVSHDENMRNLRKQLTFNGEPTSSKYKGVTWHKGAGKWAAKVCFQNKTHNLGLFSPTPTGEIEAAYAYDRKARELFGEYAHLNFQEVPRGTDA